MPVLEHHILLPRSLDPYCKMNVITCNCSTHMYPRLFVVEHEMGMFLHPHAHRFGVIVVAFVGFYRKATNDVTNVLVTYEKVPGELLPSFTYLQESFPVFCHYLWDKQSQAQVGHDEIPNLD
jgi:hypothetical protein